MARALIAGQDISQDLVKAGLAWHFKKYSSDPVLAKAGVVARRAKVGLWSMPGVVPPWEWRRESRRQPHTLSCESLGESE